MTVRSVPWIPSTASIAVPSEIARLAMTSLVPSPGIASTTDLAVAAHGTPNMTVDVAAGGAWIKGTTVATQGSYFLYNDASLSVAIAASDPSNPRIDLIVAVIRDNAEDASGSTDARIIAVTGTPAGSPVAPSAPASSIILAQIAVAATTTTIVSGNITDKRGATCGDGFVVCTSGTRPTARTALPIYETDTGIIRIHNGTAWVFVAAPGTGATDAFTTYTPTFTNITSGAGSFGYKLEGKKLTVRYNFTAGTATAGGNVQFSLPAASTVLPGIGWVPVISTQSLTGPTGYVLAYTSGGATTVQVTKDAIGTGFTGGNNIQSYAGWFVTEVQ